MHPKKQVDRSHYEFQSYMDKGRWNSIWHQLDEAIRLNPDRVLEIGPGTGAFKQAASLFGLRVETLDLDPDLKPDHVGSATCLPFPENTYDLVCAFQMLEHLPYDLSLAAFREMARVARRNVLISLPDAKTAWPWSVHLPRVGAVGGLIEKPGAKLQPHEFDGEHYWEVNKQDYCLNKVMTDFSAAAKLVKTYRVQEYAYHRFFLFEV